MTYPALQPHPLLTLAWPWVEAALVRVQGQASVRRYFAQNLQEAQQWLSQDYGVIALGKASASMLQGLLDVPDARQPLFSFLVTKYAHLSPGLANSFAASDQHVFWQSAHPIPDENSLAAGAHLLHHWIPQLPDHLPILVFISGGASALIDHLHPSIDLSMWQKINGWLLASGWDISRMNAVRSRFSAIKGGGLLQALGDRPVLGLVISDVIDDDVRVIASGPLCPAAPLTPADEALLPSWIRQILPPPLLPHLPKVKMALVGTNRLGAEEFVHQAALKGVEVRLQPEFLQGDVGQLADAIVQKVLEVKQASGHDPLQQPQWLLWGGEPTVTLPQNPGQGGRNQHLALLLAKAFSEHQLPAFALCIATDGSDGPTHYAGAYVDGHTWADARSKNLDPQEALDRASATPLLAELGLTLRTGPTGTNVMDWLLIAIP